jgi:hypothetical protein
VATRGRTVAKSVGCRTVICGAAKYMMRHGVSAGWCRI